MTAPRPAPPAASAGVLPVRRVAVFPGGAEKRVRAFSPLRLNVGGRLLDGLCLDYSPRRIFYTTNTGREVIVKAEYRQ